MMRENLLSFPLFEKLRKDLSISILITSTHHTLYAFFYLDRYASIAGLDKFVSVAQKLAFGKDSTALKVSTKLTSWCSRSCIEKACRDNSIFIRNRLASSDCGVSSQCEGVRHPDISPRSYLGKSLCYNAQRWPFTKEISLL